MIISNCSVLNSIDEVFVCNTEMDKAVFGELIENYLDIKKQIGYSSSKNCNYLGVCLFT